LTPLSAQRFLARRTEREIRFFLCTLSETDVRKYLEPDTSRETATDLGLQESRVLWDNTQMCCRQSRASSLSLRSTRTLNIYITNEKSELLLSRVSHQVVRVIPFRTCSVASRGFLELFSVKSQVARCFRECTRDALAINRQQLCDSTVARPRQVT
jgi:hypothetical protein